jgi:NAD(P)-dependent dehydrogenase (short-subunit alcohol dehydrogenase family)
MFLVDLVNQFSVSMATPYSVSKAALNMLVAKYSAAYAKHGILFMAISPGLVDTSEGKQRKFSSVETLTELVETNSVISIS